MNPVAFQIWTSEFWWAETTAHKEYGEGCIFFKHHRENFLVENSYRACTPLEIVHSDICGPMQTSPISGCNYFLTFIDDYLVKHGYIF